MLQNAFIFYAIAQRFPAAHSPVQFCPISSFTLCKFLNPSVVKINVATLKIPNLNYEYLLFTCGVVQFC